MEYSLITLPDENLRYISHERVGDRIVIHVESTRTEAVCPYCGTVSGKIHSLYERTIHDLPLQGNKTCLRMKNRKYFCVNVECGHKTFAEPFSFYEPKTYRTKRLQEEILRVALTQSSISASRYLRSSVVDIGKSAICEMLKKGR